MDITVLPSHFLWRHHSETTTENNRLSPHRSFFLLHTLIAVAAVVSGSVSYTTMGRRRNTAKTGDKALYKKRDNVTEENKRTKTGGDNDPTFDEVDRFHNQRDEEFLKFSREGDDDEESQEDEIDRTEAVMDLGLGGESSSDDDSSDDESAGGENGQAHDRRYPMGQDAFDDEEEEDQVSLSDDSDNEPSLKTNVRDWGRRKSDYYNGDTADLELGQEEDDAFVEEEAAKEIQAARYEQMQEEDFVLSDDEEQDEAKTEESDKTKMNKDVAKLSRSEKARMLDQQHPELLALVGHFSKVLREWKEKTNVVTSVLLQGGDGTTEVSNRHAWWAEHAFILLKREPKRDLSVKDFWKRCECKTRLYGAI
jgi:U3 small nucleolar RNA-associated protein 3